MGSAGAVSADSTPAPSVTTSTSNYGTQLAAYKVAIIKYRVAVLVNTINYRIALEKYSADWQAALATYQGPYKIALTNYQTLQTAYAAKLAPIAKIRKTAVDFADTAFLAANSAATTTVQMDAALQSHTLATAAANTAYKNSVATLGTPPVKPVKPAELTKPPVPVKPIDPTKPIAPIKPAPKPAK